MIYTEYTKKAMKLMCQAHQFQADKSGLPYILHPWHVAEMMDDEASTIVALLHDVIEDTSWTLDDLRAEGFSQEVLSALALMTHDKGLRYHDYIVRMTQSPLACKVKMADLQHNMQLERLDHITESDRKRLRKYQRAYDYLASIAK